MEADEVYSELGDKISSLQDKVSEFQGTIDYLKSAQDDLKSTLDKTQEAIQQLNDLIAELKSKSGESPDTSKTDGLFDQVKAIEAANAESDRKAMEQAGILGKLAQQADAATQTLVNFPDTMKGIVGKAVSDGKAEILNIYDNGQKALMNSLSDYTTKAIKDAKDAMWTDFKSWISDTDLSKPKPVLEDDLEAKVRDIVAKVKSEASSDDFEQKVRDVITKVQSEKTS
ncbi:MAG TPA: hypothetical protein VGN16_17615 [Acidobacteriaceae bacterium]|jgi:chromosome segregation ATPase